MRCVHESEPLPDRVTEILAPDAADHRAIEKLRAKGRRFRGKSISGERLRRYALSRPLAFEERTEGSDHAFVLDPHLGRPVALLTGGRPMAPHFVTEFIDSSEASFELRLFVERLRKHAEIVPLVIRDRELLESALAQRGLRVIPSPGWGRRSAANEVLDALGRILKRGGFEEPAATEIRLAINETTGTVAKTVEEERDAAAEAEPDGKTQGGPRSRPEPRPRQTGRPQKTDQPRVPDPGHLRDAIRSIEREMAALERFWDLDKLEADAGPRNDDGRIVQRLGILKNARLRYDEIRSEVARIARLLPELPDAGSRQARSEEVSCIAGSLEERCDRIRYLVDRALHDRERALEVEASRRRAAGNIEAARPADRTAPWGRLHGRALAMGGAAGIVVAAAATAAILSIRSRGGSEVHREVFAWERTRQGSGEWGPARPVPPDPLRPPGDPSSVPLLDKVPAEDPVSGKIRALFNPAAEILEREEAARGLHLWAQNDPVRSRMAADSIYKHLIGHSEGEEGEIWRRKLAPRLGFRLESPTGYLPSDRPLSIVTIPRPVFEAVDRDLVQADENLFLSLDPEENREGIRRLKEYYRKEPFGFGMLVSQVLTEWADETTRSRFQQELQGEMGLRIAFVKREVRVVLEGFYYTQRAKLFNFMPRTERTLAAETVGAILADPFYGTERRDLINEIRSHLVGSGQVILEGKSEIDIYRDHLLGPLSIAFGEVDPSRAPGDRSPASLAPGA